MEKITLRLRVLRDETLVCEKVFDGQAVKIGRLRTHHLVLDDEDVAMTHAVVQVTGRQVMLYSLDAQCPTLVNGDRVEKRRLASGDIVTMGRHRIIVETVVHEHRSKAAVPPSAPGPNQPAPHLGSRAAAPSHVPGMVAVPGLPGPARSAPVEMTEAERTAAAARLVDLNRIEDSSRRVLEVIPVWQNTVFDVSHLTSDRPAFTIGEEPSCDFWLPADRLGGATKVTLASGTTLHRHSFMKAGDVTFESGERKPLGEVLGDRDGYEVPEGARLRIEMGEVTMLVNSVPYPRRPRLPFKMEWSYHSFNGASLLGVIAALFMVFFFPPSSRALSLGQIEDASIYHRVLWEPAERIPEDELPAFMQKKDENDEKEGGTGERHKGDEGQMGDIKAKKSDKMYGIKGPENNPDPHMARDQKKDMAKDAGILSVLSQSLDMPTSPFGRETALGNDAQNALGSLMGTQIGPNFGFGGLGMSGTGEGGGGTGEGTIGLGKWGMIGHGAGTGKGVGYGHGSGGLKAHHKGKVPPIKPGHAVVKGSLSKEVIRRVIRQHLNEVRFCYEQGLSTKPDLEGRVIVSFIISPTGTVQSSSLAKSTVGSNDVEQCIVKAVRRWSFPSPDGGVVLVKYPFLLQSAGEK